MPFALRLEPTNGVISGIPQVTGVFNVTIFATNAAATTTGQLALTFTTGVPGITSSTNANGKQGVNFSYTIRASNDPVIFSAVGLPAGLNLNLTNGLISGPAHRKRRFPGHHRGHQRVRVGQPGADHQDCLLAAGDHQRADRRRHREPERLQLHHPGEQYADLSYGGVGPAAGAEL